MSAKIKGNFYLVVKYLLFFILFYLLQKAEVCELHPFGFGMFFALVWCNQKIWVLAPMFVLASFLCDFSIESVISSGFCALFFVLVYFAHLKFKKPLKPWLIGFYAFLSQFVYLYQNVADTEQFMLAFVSVILGLIAMFAYLYFMQSILLRGIKRQYTIDELVSAGVLLLALGAGLASVPDYNYLVLRSVSALLVLLVCTTLNFQSAFSFSTMLGLGISISSINTDYFVLLIVWTVLVYMLKNPKKIFSCVGLLCADVFVNLFFFSYYDVYYLLSLLIAILLFLIIPQKSLSKISSALILGEESDNIKNIFERNRRLLAQKIMDTSQVFEEMQTSLKLLAKNSMSKNDAKVFLTDEICKSVCKRCEQCDYCLKVAILNTKKEFEKLIDIGFSRGKVNAIDLSSNFMATCSRVNIVLNTINNLIRDFKLSDKMQQNINNTRMIIAEQMGGVSEIFKTIAKETDTFSIQNINKEQQILEGMLYAHITCSDVVVYCKKGNEIVVSCIIKTSELKQDVIIGIISKILKQKMEITSIDYAQKPLFSIVTLQSVTAYDIVFGSAGATKNGNNKSGDTHSILRLDDGKFLMALSDGMGNGENANHTSNLTLSLIESFYRAGFDSNTILSNANRLLALKGEESFSALDVCVFDLKKAMCDVIKLGSPCGFIKGEETKIIEANSLPLGIVDEIMPTIQSYVLKVGDFVIFVTDGITDAFNNNEELQNFINNQQTTNPQILAEAILDKALEIGCGYANDDMTVLVGKIWEKV